MKKKFLLLLAIVISFSCLASCNDEASTGSSISSSISVSESTSESTSDSSVEYSSTEDKGTPDFPENDFGKDNEASYPDAWN